jgi:hypothetical protein
MKKKYLKIRNDGTLPFDMFFIGIQKTKPQSSVIRETQYSSEYDGRIIVGRFYKGNAHIVDFHSLKKNK